MQFAVVVVVWAAALYLTDLAVGGDDAAGLALASRVVGEVAHEGHDAVGVRLDLAVDVLRSRCPHLTVEHRGADPARLIAATEVAIHRIVSEAVTNAVRHADATTCRVTIELAGDHLRTTIADRLPQLLAQRQPAPVFPDLTDREREILVLLADGLPNAAIGRRLAIAVKTVANHVSNILLKLQVPDRTTAAMAARVRQAGLGTSPHDRPNRP